MKVKAILLLGALCAATCLTGCVTPRNGFAEFYQDRVGAAITNAPPYSGETQIVTASANPTNDLQDILRNNYALIGVSAFTGPSESPDMLRSQARKVGADVVLLSCDYLGTEQVNVPVLQYHPGEIYTTTSSGTVNANAYGSGGYAYGTGNYYGNSTTTSPGSFSTQMVPTTVLMCKYEVGYFRKRKAAVLGVIPTELPSGTRQALQRNTGVVVALVINNTPAFNANILDGDVIVAFNGEDVESVKDFSDKLSEFAGQKVNIGILRSGEPKNITVLLNNKP